MTKLCAGYLKMPSKPGSLLDEPFSRHHKMKKILLAAIFAFSAQASSAGFVSGNRFMELTPPEKRAYVVGVSDSLELWNIARNYCLPKGATIGQISAVAEKYLTNNPEERHMSATSLISYSLQEAFPCK